MSDREKKLGFIILLAFLKLKTYDIMLISSSIRELCRVSPPMLSYYAFFSATFKKKFQKLLKILRLCVNFVEDVFSFANAIKHFERSDSSDVSNDSVLDDENPCRKRSILSAT